MKKPKVSIMFPSYNHGEFLAEAMESVLKQTFQDFEVIISDDNSSDNTIEILDKYKDNEKVKINCFKENQGATRNMLYIWEQCQGEYIALINSDDVWLEKHLEKSVEYLDTHAECGVVFSWASFIDEDSKVIDPCFLTFKQPNRTQAEWIRRLFCGGNCLCHPSMVIRREVYENVGFLRLAMRQLPDFNIWVRIVKKYNIHILQEVLVQHRRCIHTNQNTSAPVIQNSIRDINESLYTLCHFFDDLDDELFKEAFRPLFRNKNANSSAEIKCEKFFLMYDQKYYMKKIPLQVAFNYFLDIYDDTEVADTFKNTYAFTMNDFHTFGAQLDILGIEEQQKNGRIEPICNQNPDGEVRGFFQRLKRVIK